MSSRISNSWKILSPKKCKLGLGGNTVYIIHCFRQCTLKKYSIQQLNFLFQNTYLQHNLQIIKIAILHHTNSQVVFQRYSDFPIPLISVWFSVIWMKYDCSALSGIFPLMVKNVFVGVWQTNNLYYCRVHTTSFNSDVGYMAIVRIFCQIKSFRRFRLAFGFGLQTFYLINFS